MKFDIYVINRFGTKTYLTEFDPLKQQDNLCTTFNEKLSCQDNSQTTLTFSIAKNIIGQNGETITNPLLKYLKFGANLVLDTALDTYELVITQIQPQLSTSNVIYNFTCQDMVSYKWSRIKVGYSYDSLQRGGVKTLYEIAADILYDCGLNQLWFIKDTNSHFYPNTTLKTEKITLQIDNSNPYNTLIEALNTLNASMLINYRTHEIRFYQKDKVKFSGYRYRPETNLRSLSADYNIDELATILHVVGGTNENNMNIMLVPPIPTAVNNYLKTVNYILPSGGYSAIPSQNTFTYTMYTTQTAGVEYDAYQKEIQDVQNFCTIADKVPSLGQFLYNFDFFKQNGSMSLEQYNTLKNIFDVQMRDINVQLKPLTVSYYNTLWEMQKSIIDIKGKLEQVNALYMRLIKENRYNSGEINASTLLDDIAKLKQDIVTDFIAQTKEHYIALYSNSRTLTTGALTPELQNIQNEVNNYIKIRDNARYYYYKLQDQYYTTYGKFYTVNNIDNSTTSDMDQASLEADITYYYDRFYLALQMCGMSTSFEQVSDITNVNSYYWYNKEYLPHKQIPSGGNFLVRPNPSAFSIPAIVQNFNEPGYAPSYYQILLSVWFNNIGEDNAGGIYALMLELEQDIANLWTTIYNDYSQFIYEATYENSNELDSVSLYNQAIAYFEDYHHPKSNYSIEIINLEDLEQVGVPNLKVNSRIKIYNQDLNLNEGDNLNNISYTPNELTITGLDYELRKSAVMSISVESTVQHQNILQKLIKSIK